MHVHNIIIMEHFMVLKIAYYSPAVQPPHIFVVHVHVHVLVLP